MCVGVCVCVSVFMHLSGFAHSAGGGGPRRRLPSYFCSCGPGRKMPPPMSLVVSAHSVKRFTNLFACSPTIELNVKGSFAPTPALETPALVSVAFCLINYAKTYKIYFTTWVCFRCLHYIYIYIYIYPPTLLAVERVGHNDLPAKQPNKPIKKPTLKHHQKSW